MRGAFGSFFTRAAGRSRGTSFRTESWGAEVRRWFLNFQNKSYEIVNTVDISKRVFFVMIGMFVKT